MTQELYNFSGAGDAPHPAMTKDKLCYQGRMGVKPTTTSAQAFRNSAEGGLLPQQQAYKVMEYTGIEGKHPNAVEMGKAPPPGQNRMGG